MSGTRADRLRGDPLGALAEEFVAAIRRGEKPTVEEYAARHPEQAEEIRDLFPAMLAMERLGAEAGASAAIGEGAPPTELGGYRILRRIGEGGMGVVYEAVRTALLSHVALKVMHPRYRADATYLRRFHNEACSAAKLHHTNIVSVFDYGEQDGVCYYVMQYIPGQGLDLVLADLRRLRAPDEPWVQDRWGDAALIRTVSQGLVTGGFGVATGAPLESTQPFTFDSVAGEPDGGPAEDLAPQAPAPDVDPEPPEPCSNSLVDQPEARYYREVARVGAQVAQALAYAHQRGVVHRDIKPSNLLIDARGNVWITDFGLAKFEESGDLSVSLEVVGTLRYMSPERLEGKSDPRCDIYSLGATLYELLTLRSAFHAGNQMALIDRIRHVPPKPLRQHDRRIPRDLETIVLKAMAKDPDDRFPNAQEMAAELGRFVEGRPIRSRRIPTSERFWRWCRRNPATAALIGVVGFLLVGGTIASTAAALWFNRLVQSERAALLEADGRAAEARVVVDFFINDMLAAASPERAQGRPPTVDDVLERADKTIADKFSRVPRIEASIRHTLGLTYARLGQYDKARRHLARAMGLREEKLGPEHSETLDTDSALATVLRESRTDWHEAAERFRRVYEVRLRRLGPRHADTLVALNNLALVYRDRRMWREAKHLFRQALDARRRTLGPEAPATLTTLSNLGTTLRLEGRYAEAREPLLTVLDARLRQLGEGHPRTLDAFCNLAHLERDEGHYDAAERLYQFVLLARRPVLGAGHQDSLEPLREIAYLAAARGNWRAAERQYVQCLAARPFDFESAYHLALIRLRRGDRDGVRSILPELLGRYGTTTDPAFAERLARLWAVVPCGDDAPALGRGRAVAALNPESPWFALARGSVELRHGDDTAALGWLDRARRDFDHEAGRAQATALSSLALFHLGRPAEARERLTEARTALAAYWTWVHTHAECPGPGWPDWLLAAVLAREAQLALSDPGFPQDPFVAE
jgi:serine/threonine protein kinase/tetratricopeptide (TPR) repeat protein